MFVGDWLNLLSTSVMVLVRITFLFIILAATTLRSAAAQTQDNFQNQEIHEGSSIEISIDDIFEKYRQHSNIIKLSVDQAPVKGSVNFVAELVQTIDTSAFSPPSPDTAGIAYINLSDRLLLSDPDVDEFPNFKGDNLFEITNNGGFITTTTTISFSNEPTGIAYNPLYNHIFISDDDAREIYEIDSGIDNIFGTNDDSVTSFDTTIFNSYDPEGVAFDHLRGILFIVDKNSAEVYGISPGDNGVFDGVSPGGDDQVTNFDTYNLGIQAPEGIAFNADTGNLYIVGNPPNMLAEITTAGDIVQLIDISAANADKPSGLAYGPGSQAQNTKSIYITDRGVSINSDPNENDGKVYELTLPPNENVHPEAIDDYASTIMYTALTIDVAANDIDVNGNLAPTSANTTCAICLVPSNGNLINNFDGTFTYEPDLGFIGNDSFVYEICDTESLCDTASTTISVTGKTIEVQVSASSDDAEEPSSGGVNLTSSDLELVFDKTEQTVGIRFNSVNIPQGAIIHQAYIQFQVDEVGADPTSLVIQAEAVDDATTFLSTGGNLSSRPRTTTSVIWSPSSWPTVGEAGPDQQTPNIASLIQEIVNRPGWTPENSLAIIVSGTGKRVAEAFDGFPEGAPTLHVDYIGDAPLVKIISPKDGATFSEGSALNFTGIAVDTDDGDLSAGLSWESNIDGPIGIGGSIAINDLSVGDHTLTVSVTDSGGTTGIDSVQISVLQNATVLVGAGDIANCNNLEDEETAKLLDNIAGTVFTLGDNAYPDGTENDFNDCYESSWGRHNARTRPALGNHDYDTPGAFAYFDYFGSRAGEVGKGYYSYDIGNWHIIVLNSECGAVGGCDIMSPQGQWLLADLEVNPRLCTLAYWHKPLYSSDIKHGNNSDMQDFWKLLYQAGADVVLNGHAHSYERYALQDPYGVADQVHGIREFIVGTGGTGLRQFGVIQPNSEIQEQNTFGVLKLTLNASSYDWEFIPIAGQTFTDTGSSSCVNPQNDPPVANDDNVSTSEDTPVIINVAANDSDPNANLDPTSVNITCNTCVMPVHGILVNNVDGTFSYTPDPGYFGDDIFIYEICDTNLLCDTANVSITIGVNTIEVRVSSSSDDAEESSTGNVSLTSSDLELVFDGSNQTVGMRFNNIQVPQGAQIHNAYIQFKVDEINSEIVSLQFEGEAVDNAQTFTSADGNISSRARTTASVLWSPPPWTLVGEDGLDQRTLNIALIIQEIINRSGWTSGNSLAMIVTGTGTRWAESFNGDASGAPLLHIEFTDGGSSGTATPTATTTSTPTSTNTPTATANNTPTATVTNTPTATATNTPLPTATNTPTATATNTPTATATNTPTTTVTNTPLITATNTPTATATTTPLPIATNTPMATATNTPTATAKNTPTAIPTSTPTATFTPTNMATNTPTNTALPTYTPTPTPLATIVDSRISASSDDAEENGDNGNVSLTSSDLELVFSSGANQTVGMRFNNIQVPQGAQIQKAYIQFQVDEVSSDTVSLSVQGQATDNASTFTTAVGDVFTRDRTTASIPWSPPPWTVVGEAGLDQRTPDISLVVQEIVNRSGWAYGNSLALIVTGTGTRWAESFNGDASGAPLLHIEFDDGGGSSTATPTATATNTPLPTATNTPTATATNTPPPTATDTPMATATNTPTPEPSPTAITTPPNSIHVGDLDTVSTSLRNTWAATVMIVVHDSRHVPVSDATVTGTWSRGYSGNSICTTNVSGECEVTSGAIHKNNGSATFSVGAISHTELTYLASDNHDLDGDSDGTTITALKP